MADQGYQSAESHRQMLQTYIQTIAREERGGGALDYWVVTPQPGLSVLVETDNQGANELFYRGWDVRPANNSDEVYLVNRNFVSADVLAAGEDEWVPPQGADVRNVTYHFYHQRQARSGRVAGRGLYWSSTDLAEVQRRIPTTDRDTYVIAIEHQDNTGLVWLLNPETADELGWAYLGEVQDNTDLDAFIRAQYGGPVISEAARSPAYNQQVQIAENPPGPYYLFMTDSEQLIGGWDTMEEARQVQIRFGGASSGDSYIAVLGPTQTVWLYIPGSGWEEMRDA